MNETSEPGVAIILGAFRSGTTLLRKVLDGHSKVVAPAETWFLLPLLELWRGRGTAPGFDPAQAAAAIRSHLDRAQFLDCCRAFAARFRAAAGVPAGGWYVDKTPPYLAVAEEVIELLPEARFILLARDPRGILHSRATWRHASDPDPATLVAGVAADVRRLAAAARTLGDRAALVHYESLCRDPDAETRRLTDFLGLPFEPGMLAYGDHRHHEGYGDENAREHRRPHAASVDRWAGSDGVAPDVQRRLLAACGTEALATLGLRAAAKDHASDANAAGPSTLDASLTGRPDEGCPDEGRSDEGRAGHPVDRPVDGPAGVLAGGPRRATTSASAPRILALMHEGTNSRQHLADLVGGLRGAGATILEVELADLARGPADATGATTLLPPEVIADRLAAVVRTHRPDGSVAIWAHGLLLPTAHCDGTARPLLPALGVPHLAYWLDAPHWAYGGGLDLDGVRALAADPAVTHLVNNAATAEEMRSVLGFGRVLGLPYGVDTEVFRPVPAVAPEFDLVFCLGAGAVPPTPVMLEELESDAPDHDRIRHDLAGDVRAAIPTFVRAARAALDPASHGDAGRAAATETTATTATAEADDASIVHLLELLTATQLARRDVPMLDRLHAIAASAPELAPAAHWLLARPRRWIDATALVRRIDQWERLFVFSWLSRRFHCAMFSRPNLEGWGCRATPLGWIDHHEQAHTYARGRVGFNCMRWQDDVGLNPKPLEIAASGVPLLAQARSGLDAVLDPEAECATFRTAAEAAGRLRDLVDDPPGAAAMAGAALERVRREHAWPVRGRTLLTAATGGSVAGGASRPAAAGSPGRVAVAGAARGHSAVA